MPARRDYFHIHFFIKIMFVTVMLSANLTSVSGLWTPTGHIPVSVHLKDLSDDTLGALLISFPQRSIYVLDCTVIVRFSRVRKSFL